MIKAREKKIRPIIKYPGGKSSELDIILRNLPDKTIRYFEPFVGGGSVYFALEASEYFINDKSTDLMNLYKMVKSQNIVFFEKLERINYDWILLKSIVEKHSEVLSSMYTKFREDEINIMQLEKNIYDFVKTNQEDFNGLLTESFGIDVNNFITEVIKRIKSKFSRMKKLENKNGKLSSSDLIMNIDAALRSAFYIHFRYLYNNTLKYNISVEFKTAIYVYIREYCYSSMFRYNKEGEFNVPYGGISYNRKTLTSKIEQYKSAELIEQLNNSTIEELDFYDFITIYEPKKNDFIFLDPPYDTEFSTYAQNIFVEKDQERLAKYLIEETNAKFLMIIKETEYINTLYKSGTKLTNNRTLTVESFDKQYQVNFKSRNNRNVKHLIIKNY